MSAGTPLWVLQAVDEILHNLSGRSGIGDVLGDIEAEDEETWADIRQEMADVICACDPAQSETQDPA